MFRKEVAMGVESKIKLEEARSLMDDFVRRTGITGDEGDAGQRYLWTDAFAVQALFGLSHILEKESYRNLAVKLIDLVHEKLGKFHPNDHRKGWISRLPEEEGRRRPTIGGLRIGKKLPERGAKEPFDERLEWERDGQYFHYITRWINALLQAEKETSDHRYGLWAADLLKAGEKFIDKRGGWTRMYWKMSVDLSRPLVQAMGAHDPLEGLMCAESILEVAPEKAVDLGRLIEAFELMCNGQDWSTTDPLGIGGLLLNAVRAAELSLTNIPLPGDIRPEKLLADSIDGLTVYSRIYNPKAAAIGRLAFRECGLSLGLRAAQALKDRSTEYRLNLDQLDEYIPLAEYIENFWQNADNRNSSTWTEHLDINTVSLASSIVAEHYPFAFSAVKIVS